jgi:hypothetical protein
MHMDAKEFFAKLDASTELEVRTRLAAGNYNKQHAALAQEWLARKTEARESEAATRAEAREDESLSISREALRISERANSIAISAIILSAATAIIVAVIQFIS